MRTKEVIEATGVDRETLRFYESKGLLPKTRRTQSGYRIYPDTVLDRLCFIKNCKEAGFTLKEIKELIELKAKKVKCRIGRDIAVRKRQEVLNKIKSLREMKQILDCFIAECESKGEAGLNNACDLSFDTISSNFRR